MEFLGIGDLHLTGTNGKGGFSRFLEQSDAYILSEVQRVLDAEPDITNILLYGDICDSPRMSYTAHLALNEFFRRNSSRMFYAILGNHDKFTSTKQMGTSCDLVPLFNLDNVNVYETTAQERIGDCMVNFLSYPFADFKKGMLNVCHLDIAGAKRDNGMAVTSDIDPKNYNIVSGHIHSSCQIRNCYYSGTLYQTNFGESENRKGYHKIECIGKDVEVTYVPFHPKYKLKTLVAENENELTDILASTDPKNTFFRLLCSDSVSFDPALFAKLNVVERKGFKNKKELKQLEDLQVEFEEWNADINPVLNRILDAMYKEDKSEILRVRDAILAKQ